jgi:hypothetical protein
VLEARDRLGGRIATRHSPALPVERTGRLPLGRATRRAGPERAPCGPPSQASRGSPARAGAASRSFARRRGPRWCPCTRSGCRAGSAVRSPRTDTAAASWPCSSSECQLDAMVGAAPTAPKGLCRRSAPSSFGATRTKHGPRERQDRAPARVIILARGRREGAAVWALRGARGRRAGDAEHRA